MGSQDVARRASKPKAFMLSPTECLLVKRQLDLPQAFIKAYRDPQFPNGLLVSFTLDDKPVGQECRVAVTSAKNRVSLTGHVSLKHKLCLNDTISVLPPGAFVHTVIASAPQQLILACRTGGYVPQQQQQHRAHQRSPGVQQLPLQVQHTHPAAVDAQPMAKRRLHDVASKSVSSAAKRRLIMHRPRSAGQAEAAAAACTRHGGQQRVAASSTNKSYRMLQKLHANPTNLRLPGRLAKQLLASSSAASKPQLAPVRVQLWCQQAGIRALDAEAAATSAREAWCECQIVLQPSAGTGQRNAGYRLVGAGLQDQLRRHTGCSIVAAHLLAGVGRNVWFELAPAGVAAAATTVQWSFQQPLQSEHEQRKSQPPHGSEAEPSKTAVVDLAVESSPVAAATGGLGGTNIDDITSDSCYSGSESCTTSSCTESADDASCAHESNSDVEIPRGSQQLSGLDSPLAAGKHSSHTAADRGHAAAGRAGMVGGSFGSKGHAGGKFQSLGRDGANAEKAGAGGHSGGNSGDDGSGDGNSSAELAGSAANTGAMFAHMNQNVTRRLNPELPRIFLEGCFPQLRSAEVGTQFAMDVQLLLLPPGQAAAADVTEATLGVRVLADKLPLRLMKRSRHTKPLSPGSTAAAAAAGQQDEQQQQQPTARYLFAGSSTVALVTDATSSADEKWAVGVAKLGPSHLRLMFSTEAPASSLNRIRRSNVSDAAAQPAAAATIDVKELPFVCMKRKMDTPPTIPKAFILQHLPEIEKLQHSDEMQIDIELVYLNPTEVDINSTAGNRQNSSHMRVKVRRDAIHDRTFIKGVCSAASAGWWLVGMRKLGETYLQLLLTATEPAGAASHPRAGSGSGSSSMHGAKKTTVSRDGSFTGQNGGFGLQQQCSAQAGGLSAGPFRAAAAAPFSSRHADAAHDCDNGSSSDSESDDEDLHGIIRPGEQQGVESTGQQAVVSAAPGVSSVDYALLDPRKVVQNLYNAPRLPIDLVTNYFPSFPSTAGSTYSTGAPLDVEVVWLPPCMSQMSPEIQPLDVLRCPESTVVKKYSKSRADCDTLYARYYVTGPSLQKALNAIAAKAQAAAGPAVAAAAGDDDFREPPVWLVGLQPTGPAALRLLLTSQLSPDAKPYKFKKSKLERMESRIAAAERRAAAGETSGPQPSAGTGLARGRIKGSGECYWPCLKRPQPALAAQAAADIASGLRRAVSLGREEVTKRSGSGGIEAGGTPGQPAEHGLRLLLRTGSGAASKVSIQHDANVQQEQQQLRSQHSGGKREQQQQQSLAGGDHYFHDPLLQRDAKRSRMSVAPSQLEQQQARQIAHVEQQAGGASGQSGAAAAATAMVPAAAVAEAQPQEQHHGAQAGAVDRGGVRLPALHNPRKPAAAAAKVGAGKHLEATQHQRHLKGAKAGGSSGSNSANAFAHILSSIGRGMQFSDGEEETNDTDDDMLLPAAAVGPNRDETAVQQQQESASEAALGAWPIQQLQAQQQHHQRGECSKDAFGSVVTLATPPPGRHVAAQPSGGTATEPQHARDSGIVAGVADWQEWQEALPLPKLQQQQQHLSGGKLPADLGGLWRPGGAQKQQLQQQQSAAGAGAGGPPSGPSLQSQRLSGTDKGLKVRLSSWQASLPSLQLQPCGDPVKLAVQFVDAASGDVLGGPDDCLVRSDGSAFVRLRYSEELMPCVRALDGALAVRLSLNSSADSSNEVPSVVSIHVVPASAASHQQGEAQAAQALRPQTEALVTLRDPLLQQEQQGRQQLTAAQVLPAACEQQQQQCGGVSPNLTAAAAPEEFQQSSAVGPGTAAATMQQQQPQQLSSGQHEEQQQSTPQVCNELLAVRQQQQLGMQPSDESGLLSRVLIKPDPGGLQQQYEQQQHTSQQLPIHGGAAGIPREKVFGGGQQVAVKAEQMTGITAARQQQHQSEQEHGQDCFGCAQQLKPQQQAAAQQACIAADEQTHSPHTSAVDAGGMSDADGSTTPPAAAYTAAAAGWAAAQQQQQPLPTPAAGSLAGTAAPAASDHSQQPVSGLVGGSAGASAAAAAVATQLQLLPAADAVTDEVEDSLLQLINDLQAMSCLSDNAAAECMEAVEQLLLQEGDVAGNAARKKKFKAMYKMLVVAVRNNNGRLAATLLQKHLLHKQGKQ